MKNKYAILSSSCKVVKGYSRSIIIDYSRGDLFFISHQYADLIENLDRRLLKDIYSELEDEESVSYFEEFLEFLLNTEVFFLVDDVERFPKISDITDEYFISLQDVILEIDESCYFQDNFINLCNDLTDLRCKDFQIRLLSDFNVDFLSKVIEIIDTTNCNYLEIHCTYNEQTNNQELHKFIEENAIISKIFIYNSPSVSKYNVINDIEGYYPISLGEVWYIDYPFDNGNCCGVINYENLNFTSSYLHNKLKNKNGCLDKKITIDKFGNIKNCPSMKNEFGNIQNTSIKEVIKNELFTKFWNIHKDQISICKICEFRYNCTDCRAFIENEDDIYSKPSKCNYNPITCTWN